MTSSSIFFTPRKIPWKFHVDILIRSVSGRRGQEGGTWGMLRVPERRHEGHGYPWCHEWCFFTPRKIPWKFHVDISIISVSRRRSTWRTLRVPDQRHGGLGHSWHHECFFLPLGRYPENFVLISQLEVCQIGASRRGLLGGHWGFLTGDLDDMVIPDIMNDVLLTPRKIPWKFYVDISMESVSGRGFQGGGYL